MNRRLFLKGALTAGAAVTAVGAGLLTPLRAFADVTPKFKGINDQLVGSVDGAAAGSFKFKAPKIAENGAVVPIEVNASKMNNVSQIAIMVRKAETQLAASFNLSGSAVGFVSTRIKMGQSSPVSAVVVAGGKMSAITKEIKVTVGGCGG